MTRVGIGLSNRWHTGLLRDDLTLSIWEQLTGRYLGGTGLYPHDWEIGYFEIGYWLRVLLLRAHGYITEAVQLLTNYALDSLKANRTGNSL